MTDPLDNAIRVAWAVTMSLSGGDDAAALEALVVSVQACADRRSPPAIAACVRQLEVISTWSATSDPELAARASSAAAGLRAIRAGTRGSGPS